MAQPASSRKMFPVRENGPDIRTIAVPGSELKMNFNPKAPAVYKPGSRRIAAPAVYRPQQSGTKVQMKPATSAKLESRPAPPVYRPQLSNASSAPPAMLKASSGTSGTHQQAQYVLGQPVWVGNGRQQIRVMVKGSAVPVGSVDIHYNQPGKAYISDLEVAQSHRRHGAATMLMKAAMESARRNGSGATELEVRPGTGSISNQALVGMYQKLGFKSSGLSSRGNPRMTANLALQRKPAIPSVAPRSGFSKVVQRMEEDPFERLKRTHERNLFGKAVPQNDRAIYDLQESSSYGYDNPVIDDGVLKGSFRPGWGGQPFLSVNKDDYGGATGKSDYDSIIAVFQKDSHPDYEIAEAIIVMIDYRKDPLGYSDETVRAMSLLVQLTQVIEPHDSRFPGADKWARACLTEILNGRSSFYIEFNRATGNYLPARAKSGGSKFGGQESVRALVGKPKKSDKAKKKDVLTPGVRESLAAMSDSSDDDMSEEEK